jgi:four helix bundle protein
LNIAEGNRKYTSVDLCRFFGTTAGAALECATCLDVLVSKTMIEKSLAMKGKEMLLEIVYMLIGLVRSNSPSLGV